MYPVKYANFCISDYLIRRYINPFPYDLEDVIGEIKPDEIKIDTWLYFHDLSTTYIDELILNTEVSNYITNPQPYTGTSPHTKVKWGQLDFTERNQWFVDETGDFPLKATESYSKSIKFNYNQLFTAFNKLRYLEGFRIAGSLSGVKFISNQTGIRTIYLEDGSIFAQGPVSVPGTDALEEVIVREKSSGGEYYIYQTTSVQSTITASIKDNALYKQADLISSLFTYLKRDVNDGSTVTTTFDYEFHQLIDDESVLITEAVPTVPLNQEATYSNKKERYRAATEYKELTMQTLFDAWGAPYR